MSKDEHDDDEPPVWFKSPVSIPDYTLYKHTRTIVELPPEDERPRAFIGGRFESSPLQELPPKTEPKLPYAYFQVAEVRSGDLGMNKLLFVLDADGEVWVKPINSNGVAVSSTALWVRSK